MKTTNKIKSNVAYHEAGHVMALLLVNKSFKYVTIIPGENKIVNEITLGHVKTSPIKNRWQWETRSFYDPSVLDKFFTNDFVTVAGLVAEKMYTGRFNNLGAGGDFQNWVNTTLIDMPDKLCLSYQKFILEYTKEVFEIEVNWIRIVAVAEALLERNTLTYSEVKEVQISAINKNLTLKLKGHE